MRRFAAVLFAFALFAAPAAAKGPLPEPDDGPDARGVTVSGVGVSTGSRPAALLRAIADARVRAATVAATARLTLGPVVAVVERDAYAELGYVDSRRSPFVTALVAVTFATAETAAAEGDRAIVGVGVGRARVRPRNRRSSASIRAALQRARLAATPDGLGKGTADAAALADAAGMPLGALFSIAEVRRPQQDFSWTLGSFGAGRYCGTVRVGRRGSRRTTVRCFYPFQIDVALRVTYVAA